MHERAASRGLPHLTLGSTDAAARCRTRGGADGRVCVRRGPAVHCAGKDGVVAQWSFDGTCLDTQSIEGYAPPPPPAAAATRLVQRPP